MYTSQICGNKTHHLRSHKYTLFLSTDGNFRLQRKNKVDDPDDVALNDGNGYFVETEMFGKYKELVGKADDVSNNTLHGCRLLLFC